MTSVQSIHWQDPRLWPDTLKYVPAGYSAVTDQLLAQQRILYGLAGSNLTAEQEQKYVTLWTVCLERGWQSSGLVLVSLWELRDVLGHSSSCTMKAWGRWCTVARLWVNVPGKLYPYPRGRAPGQRSRAFLVIQPSGGARP